MDIIKSELTIGIDSCEGVGDDYRSHDHHDGDNEVGHEGIEAKEHVGPESPPHLNDLQEGMCLQAIAYAVSQQKIQL